MASSSVRRLNSSVIRSLRFCLNSTTRSLPWGSSAAITNEKQGFKLSHSQMQLHPCVQFVLPTVAVYLSLQPNHFPNGFFVYHAIFTTSFLGGVWPSLRLQQLQRFFSAGIFAASKHFFEYPRSHINTAHPTNILDLFIRLQFLNVA